MQVTGWLRVLGTFTVITPKTLRGAFRTGKMVSAFGNRMKMLYTVIKCGFWKLVFAHEAERSSRVALRFFLAPAATLSLLTSAAVFT